MTPLGCRETNGKYRKGKKILRVLEFLCTRKLKITPEKNYQACNIQNVCLYMGSSKQIHAIKCNTFNRYWGDSLFNALQANTFRGNTWKCSLQNETFNKYASQELSHWVCFNLKWMLFFFFERACHIFQCLSPKPTNLACWIFLIYYLNIWIEPNTHIIYVYKLLFPLEVSMILVNV